MCVCVNINKSFWVQVCACAWMWSPCSAFKVQIQHTSPTWKNPTVPSPILPFQESVHFKGVFCAPFSQFGQSYFRRWKKIPAFKRAPELEERQCLCLAVPQGCHLILCLLLKKHLPKTVRAKLLKPGVCTTFYKLAWIHQHYRGWLVTYVISVL